MRKGPGEKVIDVEQWAKPRREEFVAGMPIKRLVRETGLSKNPIRRALRSDAQRQPWLCTY